jgi:tRNA uridine 5-carbamoylmethylation protein Kti12
VYCDTKADACRTYNEARSDDKYSDVLMSDLLGRMEVPSDRVKWDKPLFIVEVGVFINTIQFVHLIFHLFFVV